MTFVHKVNMQLQWRGLSIVAPVSVMQGDNGRLLQLELRDGNEPWEPPEDASVQVGYTREDGSQWTYDSLPDGTPAGSIEDNVVTVMLAPAVLARPGKFPLAVTLISGGAEISTFPVMLQVTARPGYEGGEESGGIYTGIVEVE